MLALRRGNPATAADHADVHGVRAVDLRLLIVQMEGLDSAAYKTDSAHQLLKKIPIPAVRGGITTSDGTVLAMTVQTYTVFADPEADPGGTASRLCAAKLAATRFS